MKYEELIILLPCHSIEDFPLHHEGDRAEGLLACWTALWHPAFIASARTMPAWRRVDERIDSLANRLIVVPEVSEDELPPGFEARAEREGGCLIRHQTSRESIVAAAVESFDGGDHAVDAELAADFHALGYCYLQIELLTRLMRYASSLDEIHFQDQLIDAADAAMKSGDEPDGLEKARDQLHRCFDTLAEERNHYYPVDSFLLDLTLVAPTTMGASLRRELANDIPCNVLLTAETLGQMERDEPESLAALREAVAQEKISILGGDYDEPELPLMSAEEVRANLHRAAKEYERILGQRVSVYGRRRHGLTPLLPQLLKHFGYSGALHATLDDGRFPEGTQARTQWEGLDGTEINAIARVPLDASRPETFLKLAATIGEYMDTDHVAVVLLAHWPGRTSPWYDDLRRITRYVPALGTMTTCEQLFSETDLAGQTDRFRFDQYRSPYLIQDVQGRRADPISRHVRSARLRARAEACQTLTTIKTLLAGSGDAPVTTLLAELDGEPPHAAEQEAASDAALDDRLDAELPQAVKSLAGQIPTGGAGHTSGRLVFNPLSYNRRQAFEINSLKQLPAIEKPIVAAGTALGRTHVVVDVPPLGCAWVGGGDAGGGGRRKKKRKPPKPMAEENVLRNEYIEAWINPDTGSLRSVYDYRTRGNRLSQQLAFRGSGPPRESNDPGTDPEELADYSIMAADAVEVTAASTAYGEITTRGRLVSRSGEQQATFRQTYQLCRGSRVLWLSIDLQPEVEPRDEPWKSYFACRFAWSDSAADMFRSMHGCRRPDKSKRIEAPDYIDIESGDLRTAILTGGLPYHRRVGLRMLDTLLIVRGETARQFRLGMGIDMTHPHQEALGMHVDPLMLDEPAAPPSHGKASWMFHVDAKNVIATRWEPLLSDGAVEGFRVRLLETAGRKAPTRLRSYRAVKSAQTVDFQGESLKECQIDDDAIVVEIGPFEWAEIEARW